MSERLLSNKVLTFNDAIQFNIKSRSLGFEGITNNKKIDYTVKVNRAVYPIIAYSDNINGGNLNQNIQVGNYTFIGDENTKAKSGIIIGGGALLGIKLYDRGRYIDLNLNASIAAAPAHDWLQVRNEYITVCSKNHSKSGYFLMLVPAGLILKENLLIPSIKVFQLLLQGYLCLKGVFMKAL